MRIQILSLKFKRLSSSGRKADSCEKEAVSNPSGRSLNDPKKGTSELSNRTSDINAKCRTIVTLR